ncbi:unnamed protein product [Gongylonema pulchrum]|uniref:Late endosomal/lysosomal adaptor and MAPK and MTOR activator 5 n=1 Tax=Gongylonema pulchrum TaxID=637853 RepID=A0A183ERH2_9BILA|nr:unnamed protein product [Gongylonema pulchrum]
MIVCATARRDSASTLNKKKNKKKKKKEKLRMRSGEHPVGQMVTGARDTSQEVYATAAAVAAASSDGNGQFPGMGIVSKKQAMVIDGMEESNVLYMIDSSNKVGLSEKIASRLSTNSTDQT